jgi:hypothetical protein
VIEHYEKGARHSTRSYQHAVIDVKLLRRRVLVLLLLLHGVGVQGGRAGIWFVVGGGGIASPSVVVGVSVRRRRLCVRTGICHGSAVARFNACVACV